MSTTHEPQWNQVHQEAVVSDHVRVERLDGPAQVGRIIGLVAGAAVTLIGVVALGKIDWGADVQFDAPLVAFANMTFTPIVAGVTALIGLVLIATAASRDGDGRVAVGAVLATVGVGIVAAEELRRSWSMTGRQGWLAIAVGIVFVLSGLLAQGRYVTGRRRSTFERAA